MTLTSFRAAPDARNLDQALAHQDQMVTTTYKYEAPLDGHTSAEGLIPDNRLPDLIINKAANISGERIDNKSNVFLF